MKRVACSFNTDPEHQRKRLVPKMEEQRMQLAIELEQQRKQLTLELQARQLRADSGG